MFLWKQIIRFLGKFLNDKSFEALCTAMEQKNVEEAFRAAHTLKGVSQNLALTKLGRSVERLTERLRNATEYTDDLNPMLEEVKADYAMVKQAISNLQ
jgi:HPt (histidine-containing phosphotransfer) domain-containing protein